MHRMHKVVRSWHLCQKTGKGIWSEWTGPEEVREQRVRDMADQVQPELRRLGLLDNPLRDQQEWSEDELERLRQSWARRPAGEKRKTFARRVGAVLGRSAGSVLARMDREGGMQPRKRPWTQEELAILREEVARLQPVGQGELAKRIAARLGRTQSSVLMKLVQGPVRPIYRRQRDVPRG